MPWSNIIFVCIAFGDFFFFCLFQIISSGKEIFLKMQEDHKSYTIYLLTVFFLYFIDLIFVLNRLDNRQKKVIIIKKNLQQYFSCRYILNRKSKSTIKYFWYRIGRGQGWGVFLYPHTYVYMIILCIYVCVYLYKSLYTSVQLKN